MKTIRFSFSVPLALVAILLAAQRGEVNHRSVQVNGIKMHIAEQGQGPLVACPEGMQSYQTYYQQPGAEKVLDADPKRTLRIWLYSSSGGTRQEHKARLYVRAERDGARRPL